MHCEPALDPAEDVQQRMTHLHRGASVNVTQNATYTLVTGPLKAAVLVVDLVYLFPHPSAHFALQPEAPRLIPEGAGAGGNGLGTGGQKAEGVEKQLSSVHVGLVCRSGSIMISAKNMYVYVLCIK